MGIGVRAVHGQANQEGDCGRWQHIVASLVDFTTQKKEPSAIPSCISRKRRCWRAFYSSALISARDPAPARLCCISRKRQRRRAPDSLAQISTRKSRPTPPRLCCLSWKRGRQRAPGSTDGRNEAPDHAIPQFSSPLVFSTEIWCCVMQAVPILVINFRLPHIQLAEF